MAMAHRLVLDLDRRRCAVASFLLHTAPSLQRMAAEQILIDEALV